MKVKVYNQKGSSVGSVDVADECLVLDRGEQAVHDVVVAYRAALRAGTASSKHKGEVAGSNRKPWRQKGLGRARAGYRQSPIWRGGAAAFGPHPRSFAQKVNRKVARLAFCRALSEKLAAEAVQVVDSLDFAEPKTRELAGVLKALKIEGPVLVVVDAIEKNLDLASRNMAKVELVEAARVHAYQVVRYPVIVATRAGFEGLAARLEGKRGTVSENG